MAVVLQDYQKNGTPILTTNKEKRHAYIGEWHSETSDSSFDGEWTSYVARRLLKTDTTATESINAWDLNRQLPNDMKMHIAWNDSKQIEHWVPNTGIAVKLGSI